jgi:hypothetical protein
LRGVKSEREIENETVLEEWRSSAAREEIKQNEMNMMSWQEQKREGSLASNSRAYLTSFARLKRGDFTAVGIDTYKKRWIL